MFATRTALTTVAAAIALSPAAALASSHAVTKGPTLGAGDRAPAAVYGSSAKAILHKGDKIAAGASILQYRVALPAKAKKQMTFTCAKGKVRGFGHRGTGEIGIDGHDKLGKRTYTAKIGPDNSTGKSFKGSFYVYCA